jgi:DNA polymerase-3 subunit gamma/tau
MFENIIAQGAADRLREDLEAGILAPSMLFYGPAASGKGTTALELGRVLSCEREGAWNCSCPSCARHRLLLHPDLLLLGRRAFAGEIAASAAVLPRDFRHGRLLLLRAARKLLGRFSPVLWEGDKDLGKINPLIQALEEDLEGLESLDLENSGGAGNARNAGRKPPGYAELGASIVKGALKLEAEGIAEYIPVAHIRRASFWGRLAPSGRRKLILIENADRMREEALNSLLKILEEPPERLYLVLCTTRREGILPTLLSRLRPYYFARRDAHAEGELIRRVFRDNRPVKGAARGGAAETPAEGAAPGEPAPGAAVQGFAVRDVIAPVATAPGVAGLEAYLDSFLPVNRDTLYPLAAFFVASLALATLDTFRRRGVSALPGELVSLGTHGAPIAGSAGLGPPVGDHRAIVAKVLAGAEDFQVRSLFPRFLGAVLDMVSESLRSVEMGPRRIVYAVLWKKHVGAAALAVGTLNQSPALALDRLISDLTGAMTE